MVTSQRDDGEHTARERPARSTPPRRVAVLYATREGQARRVAEHVAARLRADGDEVEVDDVAYAPIDVSLLRYGAIVLVASVHLSQHEREMVDFVKDHRSDLERIPSAFLSVSLAEAGAETRATSPEHRARHASEARALIDGFCEETGWRPDRSRPIAGALRYTQHNAVIRFVMMTMAKPIVGVTDTSHDVELTDWESLDRFVDELARSWARPRELSEDVAAESRG